MAQIFVGENELIESALRRFKRSVLKAEIFTDLRRIRHFETAAQKRLRKAKSKQKRRHHSGRH
ncbi:MAG: 30S ribosomal protein S21 [Verrucomicrobiota bacterium]